MLSRSCALPVLALTVLCWAAGAAGDEVSLPVLYIPNHGQADPEVLYTVRAPEITGHFTAKETLLAWRGELVRIRYIGARGSVRVEPTGRLPGEVNFLLGDSPQRWRRNIPVYSGIRYHELYPGVDMIFASSGRRLKSEFVVAPGVDASTIRLAYSGVTRVRLDTQGALVLETASGDLREAPPLIYQVENGARRTVRGSYRLHTDGTVGFDVGFYNPDETLYIDPPISYSTYLGGTRIDMATSIAVDGSGNTYVAGWTDSSNFPTASPKQGYAGSVDAFVAKINSTGSALVYATYLGGTGDDRAFGIAVDAGGSALLTGWTGSTDFPIASAVQTTNAGSRDAFVLKLTAAGSAFSYSTYFGGGAIDSGNAIAVDTSGNAYITGDTWSTNFPLVSPYQSSNRGAQEAFVAKYSPTGGRLYSTYLGGNGEDRGLGIAVSAAGEAYVTGATMSTDFPTASAVQISTGGGQDAFVTRLSAGGTSLVYSTYLGGSGGTIGSAECGNAIAVDGSGNAYIAGVTSSTNFPLAGALQSAIGGGNTDAFVVKLNSAGTARIYSTYLGGASTDFGTAIRVDSSGSAYVVGYTASPNFPLAAATQASHAGVYDAFLSQLNSAGNALSFGTYLGGSGSDGGNGVALDASGNIYVAGVTGSYNFPTLSPIQASLGGGNDVFVTRFGSGGVPGPQAPSGATVSPSSGSGATQTFSFVVADPNGFADIAWVEMLFNSSLNTAQACYIRFDRAANSVSLYTDSGGATTGPLALGSAGTLQNSQCTVNASGSSSFGAANDLTVNLSITFQSSFSGSRLIYARAQDNGGELLNWIQVGSWTVPAATGPQAPSAASVTPSSGSVSSQTFSFVVSDPNGFQDLVWIEMLFQASLSTTQACYIHFKPATNVVYLYSDTATTTTGPLTLGSSGTLQNSQCTINGSGSSSSGSGNNVTVNVSLTFQTSFGGSKLIYAKAQDTTNKALGWTQVGTWTVPGSGGGTTPQAPSAATVSPSSGTGSSQTFSFVVTDPNGFADISWIELLFHSSLTTTQACYVHFKPATNVVYLYSDTAASTAGPLSLGSSGTLQNSQCTVNGSTSSSSGAGNNVTVNLSLTFATGFGGTKLIYAKAQDITDKGLSWTQVGSWTVPGSGGTTPQTPSGASVSPSSGSGSSQTFSFIVTDPNGFADIAWIELLFHSSLTTTQACYIHFKPPTNVVYLYSDTAGSTTGPLTLGSSGTLQNSQCTINGSGSSSSGAGNNVTVNLSLTFPTSFGGAKLIYAKAQDVTDMALGWTQVGSWTIPSGAPVAPSGATMTPSSGSGSSQTFAFVYTDSNGFQDITWTQVLFNSTLSGLQACYVHFDRATNSVFLYVDNGLSTIGPMPLSSSGTLENSYCAINSSGSSSSGSGNNLTLNLSLTFKPPFSGLRLIWTQANDAADLRLNWIQIGSWVVP